MSTHARIPKSTPSPSPAAGGRHRVSASITHPYRALPTAPEHKRAKAASNPLWVITVGMGAFFAATALIMMVD